MVRIGILGCGFIGKVHAKAFAHIPNAKVVAVADHDSGRAREVADGLGAEVVATADDVLHRQDIDMVDVCLPTYLHARHVIAAARAGKHVLCEKPMAMNLEEADAMIEAAERADVAFMVGHTLRFWPEYVTIWDLIRRGELGRPVALSAARLGTQPMYSWDGWLLDPGRGGGAVPDLHIHDIDYIAWLLGRPKAVVARGKRSANGGWNHVFTTLDYGDGVAAFAEATFLVPSGFPFTMMFRAVCENGTAEFISRAGVNIEAREGAGKTLTVYRKDGTVLRPDTARQDAYEAELAYFVRCVEDGRRPETTTPADARLSLEIVLAAIRSLETGDVVGM
ncbi:MAG: Gfo/Idh/MocA family oxidoreductase [Firmicutes bacterium]|nr:Gfo/Idh/MocA family oxidoreductase [Bacillota bacterium]MDH7496162.1 Gfo/Idh/MocA family oxidoreductase [Bacillota bacterium]